MGKVLLSVALAVFVIWLVFTIIGTVFHALINLLWIIIVIALVVWLIRVFTGRRNRAL
jgi:predicted branched-subunit amino acid permease